MGVTMTGSSGIDVAGIISQLTALKQMEVTRIQEKKTAANKQIDAYTKLGSYLSDFMNKASSIKTKNDFNIFKTSSTNSDAVGVTTSYGAQAGKFGVNVYQLAESEKLISNDNMISDANTSLSSFGIAPGKFKINGTEIELLASDTLNDLRAKINNATDENGKKIGVSATILQTGSNDFRLVLSNEESGSKGAEYEGDVLEALGFIDAAGNKGIAYETYKSDNDIASQFAALATGGKITITAKDANGKDINATIVKTSSTMSQGDLLKEIENAFKGSVKAEFGADGKLEIKDRNGGASSLVVEDIKIGATSNSFSNTEVGYKSGNVLSIGKDALFSIDNVLMTSTKNSITGAVSGVDFELKKVTDSAAEISIGRDEDGVIKKVQDMIEMYNFLLKFSKEQTKYDTSGDVPVKGDLFGDSSVKTIMSSIQSIFQSKMSLSDNSVFSSLSQVGVKINAKTGEFEIDDKKMKEAMEKDYDAFVSLFVTKADSSNTSIQFGRSSNDTQEGEYELREVGGTFEIRKKGDTNWIVGKRSGDIVSFDSGPAKGLMITAAVGSGDGTLTFSKGLAGKIDEKMKQLTDYENGVVNKKKETLNDRIRTINSQIEVTQRRVDAYRDRLVKQFAAMENTIKMLQSQQSAMFSQLGSF
ncbi:MAG: flagellar filament capping protein FliD [Chitinispirillales bacterium]|jgi:flagellar hook-associated protein 2|nr:flagellar filament capping protein FliD [Chitinispirillales bacterium]